MRWWEVDPTFYLLKMLSWVRLVRDIRNFPASAMVANKS
jgi:fatty-acid desaturase